MRAFLEAHHHVIDTLREATNTSVMTAQIPMRPGFGSNTSDLAPAGSDLREIAEPL